MRHYRLISALDPQHCIEFPGLDAGAALNVACARGLDDADLFEGDRYILSIRRRGAVSSCWTIFSRTIGPKPQPPPDVHVVMPHQ